VLRHETERALVWWAVIAFCALFWYGVISFGCRAIDHAR
jgi:hypothetical protein